MEQADKQKKDQRIIFQNRRINKRKCIFFMIMYLDYNSQNKNDSRSLSKSSPKVTNKYTHRIHNHSQLVLKSYFYSISQTYAGTNIKLPNINTNADNITMITQTPSTGGFKSTSKFDGINTVVFDSIVSYKK
jgi:hypothetical protein